MMNSRWQANKIGLINFWYYDEQEFPFVKGRMLLRGSNGSGKSVTMQSVVPLLLDGNMSPERLDPFGSRDRKMSSYLLEEDDGREERTGYLYLEFKRQDSDTYLTIGMGIRARKGKNLDKWYFSLTDGRRVGKDFFLYKDTGEKVTLSKKELENRIGTGGRVIDRQADYMEYVNRQIFGFETAEEYKEMIDLLIQLRTPKLSKDFKPSVINDILSDSLQPLSDDDLRPMSEAIENMDTMNMNLKNRKEAKQAAEKIQGVFSKYNQKLLYEKAERYEQAEIKLENARTQQKEQEKKLSECRQNIEKHLISLIAAHEMFLRSLEYLKERKEHLEDLDADMEQIRYDLFEIQKELRRKTEEQTSIQEQLRLTDYEEIKDRLDACIKWLQEYPERLRICVSRQTHEEDEVGQLTLRLEEGRKRIEEYEKKTAYFSECYEQEKSLHYVEIPEEIPDDAGHVRSYLESDVKTLDKDSVIRDLNKVYFENRGFLTDYHLMQNELFAEAEQTEFPAKRLDISARYQGVKISFSSLLTHLEEDIEELENLIKDGDRELFEDILANTVSRKIRGKINASNTWVQKMNSLMNGMNTSSGLKLSLRWRSKTAEQEDQLDTKELVDLLKKDYRLMSEEEASRLSAHFRSKVAEARRNARDSAGMISFYQIMKDTLDYRKWFEFQLFSQKNGERQKELTNSVFGTFSGGEKAMSMYIPLFSAVVAKYQGGREDAPRLISLDEAFAGVDNKNIRDMFRLMTEFGFDFIINSQVLWGDCDTLDALAIYQLIRPGNAKFVTVMPYLWNGKKKELLEREEEVEQRGAEIGQQ